jgi:hypothetical protein
LSILRDPHTINILNSMGKLETQTKNRIKMIVAQNDIVIKNIYNQRNIFNPVQKNCQLNKLVQPFVSFSIQLLYSVLKYSACILTKFTLRDSLSQLNKQLYSYLRAKKLIYSSSN